MGAKTYMKETGEKRYTRLQVGSARVLKGAERHNTRPKRVNMAGNNESLIYYTIPWGKKVGGDLSIGSKRQKI